ncbi:MAG: GlsB/YeaQ/YmgE family stress response membrane protein [Anaerolineae bacterium]|nr:GlsB/YeaQ/YmgE family stress response membrane protein [Anaerolineae bacterium]
MLNIILWIIYGLVVGVLAKFIMPGRDPGGLIVTILLGIAGAFVGGFLASLVGLGSLTSFSLSNLIISVLGAIILLAIYRAMKK